MPIQILRTSVVGEAPENLVPGQLAIEMASDPPRLWVGVPTDIDPSGRRQIAGRSGGWGTGDIKLTYQTEPDPGWIFCNDGTIGPALSGANNQGPEFEALYTLLFDNLTDDFAPLILRHPQEIPVTRESAVSAVNAWTNQLRMTLPRMLGRAIAAAGAGAGLANMPLGNWLGSGTVTLSVATISHHSHYHDTPPYSYGRGGYQNISSWCTWPYQGGWSSAAGSDAAHGNWQPTTWLNAMICL